MNTRARALAIANIFAVALTVVVPLAQERNAPQMGASDSEAQGRALQEIAQLFDSGRYDAVVRKVDEFTAKYTTSIENTGALFLKADSQYHLGQTDAAIQGYESTLAKVEAIASNVNQRRVVLPPGSVASGAKPARCRRGASGGRPPARSSARRRSESPGSAPTSSSATSSSSGEVGRPRLWACPRSGHRARLPHVLSRIDVHVRIGVRGLGAHDAPAPKCLCACEDDLAPSSRRTAAWGLLTVGDERDVLDVPRAERVHGVHDR